MRNTQFQVCMLTVDWIRGGGQHYMMSAEYYGKTLENRLFTTPIHPLRFELMARRISDYGQLKIFSNKICFCPILWRNGPQKVCVLCMQQSMHMHINVVSAQRPIRKRKDLNCYDKRVERLIKALHQD